MTITDLLVLPEDIVLTPVSQLGQTALLQLETNADDYAISRPRSRTPSKIIGAEAAELLKIFEAPTTIVQAILQYSQSKAVDPEKLLDDAAPLLEKLMDAKLLVFKGSEDVECVTKSFQIGEKFGDWEICHCLQVLEDTELYQVKNESEDTAALKIKRVLQKGGYTKRLFENEGYVLQHLDGDGAPKLLEAGNFKGRSYLLIQWFPGQNVEMAAYQLRQTSQRKPLLKLLRSILETYAHLHKKGVIHGDIHPNNILVDDHGTVNIIDFGLSTISQDRNQEIAPRGGVGFYYEPECAEAALKSKPLPKASFAGEQYALGALLYRLLTGHYYVDFSPEKRPLLKQITQQLPISFSERGVTGLDNLEPVIQRALAKAPNERFENVTEFYEIFGLAIQDIPELPAVEVASKVTAEKASATSFHESLLRSQFLEAVLERLQPENSLFQEGFTQGPTASVNYGAAGVAYALYRISGATDDPVLLSLADQWIQKAASLIEDDNAFYSESLDISQKTVGEISPYHSVSGIYLVQGLIANAMGDIFTLQQNIQKFVAATQAPCENLDLTLGKTSVLIGLTLLLDTLNGCNSAYIEASPLIELGNRFCDQIEQTISGYASICNADELRNLGIAHGWGGLLYGIMRWCEVTQRTLSPMLRVRLKQLVDCSEAIGSGRRWPWEQVLPGKRKQYMPGWCNGSSGYIHLWSLAYQLYGESEYLELAKAAGVESYRQPANIGNLCCGLAGQAYGFIELYQVTEDERWLRKAEQFSHSAVSKGNISLLQGSNLNPAYGLLPNSLYKGNLGISVLIADLNRANFAAMPIFSREIC